MSANMNENLVLADKSTRTRCYRKVSADETLMSLFKADVYPDVLPSVEVISTLDPLVEECWFCQHYYGLQMDHNLRQEVHCPGCVHLLLAGDMTVEYCIPRYNARITIVKGPNPKCPLKTPTEDWEKEIKDNPHPSWTPYAGYYNKDFTL